MKFLSKYPIVVIWLMSLALVSCSQQSSRSEPIASKGSNTKADAEALKKWIDRYCATVTAGDLDGYRNFWTEDVVWLPPNAPVKEGLEACIDFNRPSFEKYNLVEKMSVEEIEVADRFAYVRVNYKFKGTPKADAEPIDEDGKGIFILRRKPDGSWVSTHCMWNSNTPIPE